MSAYGVMPVFAGEDHIAAEYDVGLVAVSHAFHVAVGDLDELHLVEFVVGMGVRDTCMGSRSRDRGCANQGRKASASFRVLIFPP